MHSPLHAFCKRDRVSTLDIVLDIEKLYPLILPPLRQPAAMFHRRIYLRKSGGFQIL